MRKYRRRRPLSHVRGREHQRGDTTQSARLSKMLRVPARERDEAVRGVHGLHPWPGRMHPVWVRRILADLDEGASLLDPFCGGGTVLVEARRAGVYARGSDLNPVAVRLARLKCIPHASASDVRAAAQRCADGCTQRRSTPFSALAGGADRDVFPRHVLAGLISLRDEIEKVPDPAVREVLLFSMSPLLDKFAARRSGPPPRVPKTAVRDHFVARVDGWLEAWEELDRLPWAEVEQADARRLPWKRGSSSAVISSPPYPGVFDYAGHQERRLRWIGGSDTLEKTQRSEIGRRHGAHTWASGMRAALAQLCRATRPGTPMYLVVGDGVERNRAVRVDDEIARMCEQLPLDLVAGAAQERPHFHRPTQELFASRPRLEHLLLLRRTDD